MKNIVSIISGSALLCLASLAAVTPASAAMYWSSNYQQQDQYIGNFCDRHPDARECNDWQSNHRHWSRSQYQSFYRYHRHDGDFGGSIAAGLFGFTTGVIISDAVSNGARSRGMGDGHVQACASAYHSYSVRTDTYLGYDGVRHECML